MTEPFFDEQSEPSAIKTAIVTAYFKTWAQIIGPQVEHIRYIDLFAGPGMYKDGTPSTPDRVVQTVDDPPVTSKLEFIFNEANPEYYETLQARLKDLPFTQRFPDRVRVYNESVDDSFIRFYAKDTPPTFSFIDPWGYKGLSLALLTAAVDPWGSDCIFFFNYNRINAAIDNIMVESHMNALFTQQQFEWLRQHLPAMQPDEREVAIVAAISDVLEEGEGKKRFVLPFRFRTPNAERTSHYLIGVSKSVKGYSVLKEILYRTGKATYSLSGVFEMNTSTVTQPTLFRFGNWSHERLKTDLCKRFQNRKVKMKQIYEQHTDKTPFIERQYKEALAELEIEGRISADPPAASRQKRKGRLTFGDDVWVTFPPSP